MKKVALIGKIHSDGINILKNNKCEVIDLTNASRNKLKEALIDIDAIALRTANLDQDLLNICWISCSKISLSA